MKLRDVFYFCAGIGFAIYVHREWKLEKKKEEDLWVKIKNYIDCRIGPLCKEG